MRKITIHSKIKNYDVKIDKKILNLIKLELSKDKNYFFIIDNKLINKYESKIKKILPHSNFYAIEGGEKIKSLSAYKKIINKLNSINFSKKDILVAFGGGTITDLVGYVAATYKRGTNLILIPTTTLAMVDASVGGKNAINVKGIKNDLGTIYPPDKVLIGLDLLTTLPIRHINNGLFESLKMGLSLNKELFNLFDKNYLKNIDQIIYKSINTKKKIVEQDEQDNNIRKVLNFGHTFGHALELNSKYNLLHGEAIANGMLIASRNEKYFVNLFNVLKMMKCPIVKNININSLINKIKNDKKANNNNVDFIQVKNIGKTTIINMKIVELERMAKEYDI